MRDLLEELLGLLPEEEKAEESDLAEGAAVPRIPEGPGAAGEQEGGEREDRPALSRERAGETADLIRRGKGGETGWSLAALPDEPAEEGAPDQAEDAARRYGQTEVEELPVAWQRGSGALSTEILYQQAARGTRSLPTVVYDRKPEGMAERMTAGTNSLTVDELDRAVRRDSRRYDGGMELY